MTDAVTSIQHDHRTLAQLVNQLADPYGDRPALLAETAARLTAHLRAEEQVHPLLAGSELDRYAGVHRGVPASGEVEERLRILRATDPNGAAFDVALREFAMALDQHAGAEESNILLDVYDRVDPDIMRMATAIFVERREQELREFGFSVIRPGMSRTTG